MKALSRLKYTSNSVERSQLAAILSVTTIALILLFFFNPASSKIYPPSPFRVITGLYCPGCGTLRGLHQLLHGHLLAALDLNPLMVLSLPFMAYALVCYVLRVMTGLQLPEIFIGAFWSQLWLKIILGYFILRNIPFPPFSWLAP